MGLRQSRKLQAHVLECRDELPCSEEAEPELAKEIAAFGLKDRDREPEFQGHQLGDCIGTVLRAVRKNQAGDSVQSVEIQYQANQILVKDMQSFPAKLLI